jgi:hypothetical protein
MTSHPAPSPDDPERQAEFQKLVRALLNSDEPQQLPQYVGLHVDGPGSSAPPVSSENVAPCDHCAGPTTFTTELAPLGGRPGHRVVFCDSCRRYTWTTWRHTQQQQQQQQQQGKSKAGGTE